MNAFWRIILNLTAIIAVMIGIVIYTFNKLDTYTGHGISVEVPQVSGISDTTALELLKRNKLQGVISDSRYDENLPVGYVIEQIPACGSYVKEGRHIYLTVNSGNRPLIAVPDVADNSSRRAAERKLTNAGFRLTNPQYIDGEKDWVYQVLLDGQVLEPGAKVPEGSELTIVIGGAEPELVVEDADSTDILDTQFFM